VFVGSVAEGSVSNSASGTFSHAEGFGTLASGAAAHAEGAATVAQGAYAHAEGAGTTASGYASHAAGTYANATNSNTYVWSDGTTISSTASNQFTVNARNGIRLLGGSISGNGSGLTNLNASSISSGVLNASNLPTSGVWNAVGMTLTNVNIKTTNIAGNIAAMTNFTLNGSPLGQVFSNFQQQVSAVYTSKFSVTVQVTANEATNGVNLIAAYAKAKTLNPSVTNRITVIVPPGRYNLGSAGLQMDTEYVDLIGQTSDRDAQHLFGAPGIDNGVIKQMADYVRIENLTVYSLGVPVYSDPSDPAAYFPTTAGGNTIICNCEFTGDVSMRFGWSYAGRYENCVGSFGCAGSTSGTFVNCRGDFGMMGLAGGTFIGCQGSFGSYYGEAAGTFINCQGDFAGGGGCIASGKFMDCNAGAGSFGGYGGELTTNAVLVNCTAGDGSFGSFNMTASNFNYNTAHVFADGMRIETIGAGLWVDGVRISPIQVTNAVTTTLTYVPPQGDLSMGIYINGAH